jgi:putative transposase
MSRPLRIEFAGALYHLISRGTAKQRIFLDDRDRVFFLASLERVWARFGWICHAYCLMDNHYHLLVETPRPNLARGMRELNGVHAQAFNRRHSRTGHLFGGRYGSILIEREPHLLEVARYIVLNPLRARLPLERLEHWRWSSYRATAGLEPAPAFLTVEWILSQFGTERSRAERAYRAFVREGAGETPWERLRADIYLGSDSFLRRRGGADEELVEIPRDQRLPLRCSLEELFRRDGEAALVRAYREYGFRLREIAVVLGVHYSTVSRRLRAAEAALAASA